MIQEPQSLSLSSSSISGSGKRRMAATPVNRPNSGQRTKRETKQTYVPYMKNYISLLLLLLTFSGDMETGEHSAQSNVKYAQTHIHDTRPMNLICGEEHSLDISSIFLDPVHEGDISLSCGKIS